MKIVLIITPTKFVTNFLLMKTVLIITHTKFVTNFVLFLYLYSVKIKSENKNFQPFGGLKTKKFPFLVYSCSLI